MKKKTAGKLLWLLTLLAATLWIAAGAAYGADATKTIDTAPFIENGRMYDAVRPIAETFGIYVDWDQEEQKVTMTRGAFQVIMEVGSDELIKVNLYGSETLSLDVAPLLRDGRVFLPTRFWAEAFGLEVGWHEGDGSVTVTEGVKTLTFAPGSSILSLAGGHFLKLYDRDEKLHFFYPEDGDVAIVWEGYAEVLLTIGEEEYVIVAMNAGSGRNDPIYYTMEEFDGLIFKNANNTNGSVMELAEAHYGVPAYRITGMSDGTPQAGVVFLRNGYLCGLTIERKRAPGEDEFQDNMLDIMSDNATDEIGEDKIPTGVKKALLGDELTVVNAILDEIMASLVVK